MVSSDHRVYGNNDSTSDSTSHAIARDDFTRSHKSVIGYFADIMIADITAGRKIDVFQKLGLAYKTGYTVFRFISNVAGYIS